MGPSGRPPIKASLPPPERDRQDPPAQGEVHHQFAGLGRQPARWRVFHPRPIPEIYPRHPPCRPEPGPGAPIQDQQKSARTHSFLAPPATVACPCLTAPPPGHQERENAKKGNAGFIKRLRTLKMMVSRTRNRPNCSDEWGGQGWLRGCNHPPRESGGKVSRRYRLRTGMRSPTLACLSTRSPGFSYSTIDSLPYLGPAPQGMVPLFRPQEGNPEMGLLPSPGQY